MHRVPRGVPLQWPLYPGLIRWRAHNACAHLGGGGGGGCKAGALYEATRVVFYVGEPVIRYDHLVGSFIELD